MTRLTTAKIKYVPAAARIAGKLADAVAALRVAEEKLDSAIDGFDGVGRSDDGFIERFELLEIRFAARLFADRLETREAPPTLGNRIFRAMARYENANHKNPVHVEGAILALMLAERSLESMLDLAGQLDGDEIDVAFEAPFAARGVIRGFVALLSQSILVVNHEAALEAILSARHAPALVA